MSIQELSHKFKGVFANQDFFLTGLIIVVSLVSFALGRFSTTEYESCKVPHPVGSSTLEKSINRDEDTSVSESKSFFPSEYVASKTGTKYHLPWCVGAKQIKEENKIYFKTKKDAEKAGYSPAANCKGI